jgi:dienelactone hydrolase
VRGRTLFPADAVTARIAEGRWTTPAEGEELTTADGRKLKWQRVQAGEDGWFGGEGFRAGWACWVVESPDDHVSILEAQGHSVAYANGEPRAGDPYGYGYMRLPVRLHPGKNEFLFLSGRGRFRAQLREPAAVVMVDAADPTLPDLIQGQGSAMWAALPVINTRTTALKRFSIAARFGDGDPVVTPVPVVPAVGVRKVGFATPALEVTEPGEAELTVELREGLSLDGPVVHSTTVKLRVVAPGQPYKRTFVSRIDGSVQYYAVNPATVTTGSRAPALFLTCHGAGVEALGQAQAYSPKPWGHIVAPTNRRPYGYDWEDWGRWDALEVLDLAARDLRTDPSRVYLTGHSMGGHGAWNLAVLFPDRFGATGPSAGWISFLTYASRRAEAPPDPIATLMSRCMSPGDTLALAPNCAQMGVYVLHGEADDNVPVTEARTMKERLAQFHKDFEYWEQPGAGHWWDASDEPGTDCVDWAPMFQYFARHAVPPSDAVRQVDFITPSPGISPTCHWVTVEMQEKQWANSTVSIRCDPLARRFSGTTGNVTRLRLSLAHLAAGEPVKVQLDGADLGALPYPAEGEAALHLRRANGTWEQVETVSPSLKGPDRYGGWKSAFLHRAALVFGTRGSAEETAWAAAKARYDAEVFRYQGNGSMDVIADTEFDTESDRDRNVVLYGNRAANALWAEMLADSPVVVEPGRLSVGDRTFEGPAFGAMFVRPRPGSDVAVVAGLGGTGIVGMRSLERVPYFVAGTGYPDYVVVGEGAAEKGVLGVLGAGFFGEDWSLATGEAVWR